MADDRTFEDAEEFPVEGTDLTEEETSDAPVAVPPAERERPTPHLAKLEELLANPKLPEADKESVSRTLEHYREWIAEMESLKSEGDEKVEALTEATNKYKRHVELELIWNSEGEFLFRQRGQLKLDNSIVEEFLPWLVDPAIIPGLAEVDCMAGPRNAFAAASFLSTIRNPGKGAGLTIRSKDQDFAISRPAFLQASFYEEFPPADTEKKRIHIAYLAAECKTNLDKTMFQEASATAHDLKVAIPGSKYFLVCEFLDMTPISSAGTDIDEVLILRGRRMGADLRKSNSDPKVRAETRSDYEGFLDANPLRLPVVKRFVEHISALFANVELDEEDVLTKGYF